MPLEVPKSPTIRTTVYDNLKGVDFTNDSTNIWHRRSPDAVNMLPDESGRPFKRTGWEEIVTADHLAELLGVDDATILKCHYFELAGLDHILIFTQGGIFVYRKFEEDVGGEMTMVDDYQLLSPANGYEGDSTDVDCYSSYDRAFFFEGDGRAAFYIYGNYKVWVYGYDDANGKFTFIKAKDGYDVGDIYIPAVLISTDPSDSTGTRYYNYNLIGGMAAVEYQNNAMFRYYVAAEEMTCTIDKTTFATGAGAKDKYIFTYISALGNWSLTKYKQGVMTSVSPEQMESVYGITITGTIANEDKITVIYENGVTLPSNVAQVQCESMYCHQKVDGDYNKEITVKRETTTVEGEGGEPVVVPYHPQSDDECVLHTDLESPDNKAWIEFYSEITPQVAEEDCIRVGYPVSEVIITPKTDVSPSSGSIKINGKSEG